MTEVEKQIEQLEKLLEQTDNLAEKSRLQNLIEEKLLDNKRNLSKHFDKILEDMNLANVEASKLSDAYRTQKSIQNNLLEDGRRMLDGRIQSSDIEEKLIKHRRSTEVISKQIEKLGGQDLYNKILQKKASDELLTIEEKMLDKLMGINKDNKDIEKTLEEQVKRLQEAEGGATRFLSVTGDIMSKIGLGGL